MMLVKVVQTAETYVFVTKWGTLRSVNGQFSPQSELRRG